MLTTTDIYPLLLDIMYKMSVLATLDYQWNLVSKSFECFVMIIYEFIFACWPFVYFDR
jgi:hypothetical protein